MRMDFVPHPVNSSMRWKILAASIFMWVAQFFPLPAEAELAPNQVMIVAGSKPDSLAVAQHYAMRRGIPGTHIVKLDIPVDETISWDDYERKIVGPVRESILTQGLSRDIRVLVTVYGVPLRVSAPILTAEERWCRQDAEHRLAAARSRLLQVERKAKEVPGQGDGFHTEKIGQGVLQFERNLAFLDHIDLVAREVVKRAKSLDPPTLDLWYQRIESLVRDYQGIAGVAQLKVDLSREQNAQAGEATRIRAQQGEGLQLLLGSVEIPVRRDRNELYALAERIYGAYGVFGLATLELSRLSVEHADASVDSELSLLWWDRRQYGAGWRQPNVLYYNHKKSSGRARKDIPVLMVSRIDASNAGRAMGLVDRAIEAEQDGVRGTVYLDARGLSTKDKQDTMSRYDQSLRDLHALITQRTSYRTVLENTETRFHRPGEAPDTALYIGWYRLRQYEDAFTFRPGAIGYHIASAEAISLHSASEAGWCKNALDRGITATLGSVGEPYLDSFPEPLEFGALLLTGQYSLVEAYYLTSRWVSWRMVLIGDPLYNPWKRAPAMPRSALTMFPLAPIAPSDQSIDDPMLARDGLQQARDQARVRLDEILHDQVSLAERLNG
ncbi:hypothetical protein W02_42790 [Nitrospira sp. KM1]|uniref:TIGR03790 family protein n=1 Tax=Nitrospira sp. KM1 TaxID=1936990 RepID=UPI0013A79142|nr:TIGR03790 family protein [Nitrospira sp. KM1]BCA57139.1 hypothetical protein W02_42790 [Nitrospira sp. KM1]